jgi:hypothetical protein
LEDYYFWFFLREKINKMEQQEKTAKTGGKQRRSTVGDRLGGSGNIGNNKVCIKFNNNL